MIIADTSVWIEYLKQKSPISRKFEGHLELRNILTLECIFGELLQGVKEDNERKIIIEYWNNLPKYNMSELLIRAGIYSSKNRLISKGLGLIDAAIYIATIETKSKLWTLDKKLLEIAVERYRYI